MGATGTLGQWTRTVAGPKHYTATQSLLKKVDPLHIPSSSQVRKARLQSPFAKAQTYSFRHPQPPENNSSRKNGTLGSISECTRCEGRERGCVRVRSSAGSCRRGCRSVLRLYVPGGHKHSISPLSARRSPSNVFRAQP